MKFLLLNFSTIKKLSQSSGDFFYWLGFQRETKLTIKLFRDFFLLTLEPAWNSVCTEESHSKRIKLKTSGPLKSLLMSLLMGREPKAIK